MRLRDSLDLGGNRNTVHYSFDGNGSTRAIVEYNRFGEWHFPLKHGEKCLCP